jgi:C4-dicarboxylate-specific signal transduction histidine kinase
MPMPRAACSRSRGTPARRGRGRRAAGHFRRGQAGLGVIRTLREFLRRGKVEHVPVDLAAMIDEVLPVLRHVLERHRVTVVVGDVTALPKVRGDRIALQQVLMNLIVNAVEAMHDARTASHRDRVPAPG